MVGKEGKDLFSMVVVRASISKTCDFFNLKATPNSASDDFKFLVETLKSRKKELGNKLKEAFEKTENKKDEEKHYVDAIKIKENTFTACRGDIDKNLEDAIALAEKKREKAAEEKKE